MRWRWRMRRASPHRRCCAVKFKEISMSAVVTMPSASTSVLVRMGQRYGVDPDKMLGTLKETAFKGNVSNEQMMALLVVADQYGLNPWTKEIYAFPDRN